MGVCLRQSVQKLNCHVNFETIFRAAAAQTIAQGKISRRERVVVAGRIAVRVRQARAAFVTNSIECLQRLPRLGLRTYVLDGVLKPGTLAIIGREAMEALKRYNFTKVFLGTNGISLGQGFTTPDPEESMVKALAAARSQETWVLADSSKFDTVTAAVMFPPGGGGHHYRTAAGYTIFGPHSGQGGLTNGLYCHF